MFLSAHTALAQSLGVFQEAQKNSGLVKMVNGVVGYIVLPVVEGLFLFTFLIFIWGVIDFIRSGDDADARKRGQQHILWGVVGIFIMISAYGIIRVIGNTIGVGDPFR